jgi:outer membrane protein assembly factor BamB
VSAVITRSGLLVWGDDIGRITAIDPGKGSAKWRAQAGGAIGTILETERGLLITSLDNFIYLYDPSTGSLRWKKRLPGRSIEVPFIREGRVFAVIRDTPEAFVLELSTGRIINGIDLNDGAALTGEALLAGGYLIVATTRGVVGFSSSCGPDSEP